MAATADLKRMTKPEDDNGGSLEHFVWLEEYKCGCSFMAHWKKDLPGYCGKHGNDSKRATLVPVPKDTPMGHAG